MKRSNFSLKTILPNQSGFKPGDSCINQLFSLAHDIYIVFLDILKAFGKVWLDVMVFKAFVRYFLSIFYFSPNDSPSKSKKNVFCFI